MGRKSERSARAEMISGNEFYALPAVTLPHGGAAASPYAGSAAHHLQRTRATAVSTASITLDGNGPPPPPKYPPSD